MTNDDIRALSVVELRDAIAAGRLTAEAATLAAIEQAGTFKDSHALFVTYTPERALADALAAGAAQADGKPLGPLHGVPITIKDNIAARAAGRLRGRGWCSLRRYDPQCGRGAGAGRVQRHAGVKVGRGNAEGMVPINPGTVFISGSNLTASKARLLLMASLMKFGALPPAANPACPTAEERKAVQAKVAEYQAVFSTH